MEVKPMIGQTIWDSDNNSQKIWDGYKWQLVSPMQVWLMGDVPINSFNNNVRNYIQKAEEEPKEEYNPAEDPYYHNEELYIPNEINYES